MDGLNHGKPYFLMDDMGGKPTIFGNTHMFFGLATEGFLGEVFGELQL